MPRYDFQCDKCNLVFEDLKRMEDCRTSVCPDCGVEAHRVYITPPMAYKEILPYFDNGLGAHVRDRADRKNLMAQKGLIEADPSTVREAKEIQQEDADRNRSKRR